MRDRREIEAEARRAEDYVARWLKRQGWKCLEQRFKLAQGEIDLIVRKKDVIAFVEVKQRDVMPTREDVVTHTNVARLMDAAEIWVDRNLETLGTTFEIRFDLALIEGRLNAKSQINYIENAFIGF